MRNGWKWLTLCFASLWMLTWAVGALAAPSVSSTSVRPHRVLQQGATADGSISTWFVFQATVTPGADNEVITDVYLLVDGLPRLRLESVGGAVYRAAIRGSDIGVGTHSLGVLVNWQTDQPQNPVAADFDPNTLIVVPQITNVLSRGQLWRVKTLFDDEALSASDPLQRDPLRPDPLDLLAPDDGSSSTRYRYRVLYRHPYGIPPQPIYASFSMNATDGSFAYDFVSDTFMPPPPVTAPPHAAPVWGTGRVEGNDFGGVYLYIDAEPHWMVPVYKLDAGGNPVPLGSLTPQDFRNGVVYEYIWEPTHYLTQSGDSRYGLPYKYGRPTDNAFVVGAGVHGYEFRAGVDHFPTEDSSPAVFAPGNPFQDPAYPLNSAEHPRITPLLSGFRSMLQPNFLHLGTVRKASDDTTVFRNPDQQLPNGPFHPQPGPTPPGTQSFPVAMGTEDTVFEFRISYQGDQDPAYIKVFISNDYTGEGYPIQLTMQPENPVQTNPGVYVARTRLPRGPHTYYFEANDGTRTVRFPVRPLDDPALPAGGIHTKGRNYFMGPFVNTKAVLSDYSVTPATGKQGTNYVFRVKYTDPNNQRPVRARLHIQLRDDPAPRGTWVTVNMVRESPDTVQYSEGVVYKFDTASDPSIVLQPGTRHYYFEFVDNWGDPYDPNTLLEGETTLLPANATTDPNDDANKVVVENTIAGPIVVENKQPYLVKPATTVGTDVNWAPDPADVGGDYLASDTFQNTATSFTFRTKYVDKNNDAPTFIKVQYRNTSDPGSVFERDLSTAPGSGTLYSDGVVYQVTNIKLPVGQTEFRFTTSDGTVVVTTDWQAGPNVVANTAPELLEPADGTVTPASGDQNTQYTFRVIYKDAEGQAPVSATGGFIRVWIDGTEYDMVPNGEPDYVNGALFEYATTLGAEPASHQYHFVASDGGNTVRLPVTGEFSGPNVNDFNKLSSPRVIITPAGNSEPRGRSDAAYTFQVTFTNPNGTPPLGNIEVVVDSTPYVLNETIPANPAPSDFRNGVTYSLTLNAPAPPVASGQHTFQFRFQNGVLATAPQNVAVNHRPALLDHKVTVDGSTATTRVHKAQRPIFVVTYQDADNDAPKFVKLFLDGDQAGVDMVSAGGTDYQAGVIYTYQTPDTLTLGTHTYRITAQDAEPFAEDADPVDGTFEVFNTKPVLLDRKVTVDGSTATTRVHKAQRPIFVVTYQDADNDAPKFVKLFLDGDQAGVDMVSAGGTDYQAGVIYTYQTPDTLTLGEHTYRITAQDAEPFPEDADPVDGTFEVFNTKPVLLDHKVTVDGSTATTQVSKVARPIFLVTYQDADNDAPKFVKLFLDDDPTGVDMVSTGGTDYQAGVIHQYQTPAPLARGTHTYRITAQDAEPFPEDADPVSGTFEVINFKPVLSDGTVTPATGSHNAEFTYSVKYTDEEGDAPAFVRVHILKPDNTEQVLDLTGSGDYTQGVTFTGTLPANSRMIPGDYRFRFEANDGEDDAQPLEGDGPTMTNAKPVLADGSVVPVRESGSAAFRYSVTYTDADNDPPAFVRAVVIQPDGSERTLDMTGSGTDYTTGVIFTADVPANSDLAPGSYGFRFEANDGYEDADPLTGTGPQVNNPPQLINPTVTPATGKLSTEFVFEVTYKDADNDAPKPFTDTPGGEVQINIDGTWYAMTRVTTGNDYVAGVTYQFKQRLSEGTHTFTFRAQDQFDAAVGPGTTTQTGPTVNKATLTLNAPTGTATLGQPVTLTGQLTLSGSATVNEQVQVTISPPVGTGELKTVNTASDGTFSVQFTPNVTGTWSAYASWAGNNDYDGVNSEPVTVQVQGATFTIQPGISMISVPLVPPSSDPDFLFGFDTREINLIRWSPQAGRYLSAGNIAAEAGAGYWVRVTSPRDVSPTGTLADQTQPFSIPLAPGWNMIGSVYLQPTLLGAAQVRVAGQLMTLAEAAQRGLVRDYAWRYDPVDRAYKLVSAGENLEPFVGYWIRALENVELVLNPPGSRSAGGTQITRSAAMSEDNWMVQLVARAGNSVDSANYIGVASNSLQIEKPMSLEDYVHVQLRSPESDTPLAVDVRRSAGTRQVYTFEVVTDMPNTPVTLSWPDVAKISRKIEMVLVDMDANVRRVLTSLPSYTYNSGANGGTRRFQIIVQPRVRTAAVISNVRVAQTRSAGSNRVQITYTLSTEASVAVQITDASGKPIRALQAGQAVGRGVNSVTWDGRNGAGVAVPAGAYMVKITATTEDGQTASMVQPVVLTR